ncbi:MAG TPA: sulfurtransferase [Sphingomonadaceae bacterium]|nr:sulfurtransferase [Sphingomonadaceae bacterium]
MDYLISTEWLAAELGARDLRVIDASLHLPDAAREARAEYANGHIPGAMFLDLAEIKDFPEEATFASRMCALGVGDGNRIVVYDNSALHSAARAWWLLRSFGARHVALLDGGLAKWKAEGRALEEAAPKVRPGHFAARADTGALARMSDVANAGDTQIVDARSAARFAGAEQEPRAGLSPGHIPGSRNLPQGQLFAADGTWKRGNDLRAAFSAAGVDVARPLITTCGSGVTAAVLSFGAHLLGARDVRLYDGSWAEWGADPATPKATGPSKGTSQSSTLRDP